MAKQSVDVMVSGGKATAAPPLGPALGPLGVNIGQVVNDINEKTKSFAGMQVPVKVEVDDQTKEFSISIGTPPASALIKQEAGVKKGSGTPNSEMVADLAIEQVIKIAQMKQSDLIGKDAFSRVKEIMGSCNSMGIMVEGLKGVEAIKQVNAGKWSKEIETGKTEISAEEKKQLDEERAKLQEEAKKHHDEFLAKAKEIVGQMGDKDNREIRKALEEAEIPMTIINEVAPEEEKK